MSEFWDERYKNEEFVYGTAPNQYFESKLKQLRPGKILLPAEGEGRNAVHAARMGWDVTAFDPSVEGKKKAEKLANQWGVRINYVLADYEQIELSESSFDCIALIYAHMPSNLRTKIHPKLINYLKPGGVLLLEGFSKNQLNNNSGGPKDPDFLYCQECLKQDFSSLHEFKVWEEEITLSEGPLHQGIAHVIRGYGIK